jgi:hypothetical protein
MGHGFSKIRESSEDLDFPKSVNHLRIWIRESSEDLDPRIF